MVVGWGCRKLVRGYGRGDREGLGEGRMGWKGEAAFVRKLAVSTTILCKIGGWFVRVPSRLCPFGTVPVWLV